MFQSKLILDFLCWDSYTHMLQKIMIHQFLSVSHCINKHVSKEKKNMEGD